MILKEYLHDKEGFIFFIESESQKDLTYTIAVDYDDGWYCTCDDYKFRKHKCKHIQYSEEYIKQKYPSIYLKYHKLPPFVEKIKK